MDEVSEIVIYILKVIEVFIGFDPFFVKNGRKGGQKTSG